MTVIVTNTMHKDGKIVETDCSDYVLNDGVRVIRLKVKQFPHSVLTNLNSRLPVYDYLKDIKPDFVFYHGLLGTTISEVICYKKKINPNCVIVQDNHLDYNIGDKFDTLKEKIIRAWFRAINRMSIKYVSRVYGVTPWRKTYAEDYFGIPKNKTDVLIMGADDEKIHLDQKSEIRERLRQYYHIPEDRFLIVTGGKIDRKKKIDVLMEACAKLPQVTLLVFGSVSEDVKEVFDALSKAPNIINAGWIEADTVYEYFFAADLVFFPGQHSVLWEQACASKVPCVFEKWEGMEHVDARGNCDFVSPIDTQTIIQKIQELIFTEKYYQMKELAESNITDRFLYSNIAIKSLECASKAACND